MSKTISVCLTLSLCFAALLASKACAQEKPSRPSPPAKAECKLTDGKTITVNYSSPRMKGRKIYGGLVPYGQVWRAGANEATAFVTDTELNIGGNTVPPGTYTNFAVPGGGYSGLVISK